MGRWSLVALWVLLSGAGRVDCRLGCRGPLPLRAEGRSVALAAVVVAAGVSRPVGPTRAARDLAGFLSCLG